jgi:hypothetical protein
MNTMLAFVLDVRIGACAAAVKFEVCESSVVCCLFISKVILEQQQQL